MEIKMNKMPSNDKRKCAEHMKLMKLQGMTLPSKMPSHDI